MYGIHVEEDLEIEIGSLAAHYTDDAEHHLDKAYSSHSDIHRPLQAAHCERSKGGKTRSIHRQHDPK